MKGWTALVTGASSGIGKAFARRLSEAGLSVVITARSLDELEKVATELREAKPRSMVHVIVADLARPEGSAALIAALMKEKLSIDLLVNSAGFGTHERVVDDDPEMIAAEIQVNCSALVDLSARLLPGMVVRGRGGIINVASTAAFQPVATMAVYAATKAFVLSFTEALWAETRGTGVRILALCPGSTDTAFFAKTGKDFLTRGRQTPDEVVETALHAFLHSERPTVVSGNKNRLTSLSYRFVPRSVMARMSARTVRSSEVVTRVHA